MNIFFNKSDPKIAKFINEVLSSDYKSSLLTSSELSCPYYTLVSIILINDQKKLTNFIETHKIEIDLVLYLIQNDLCIKYTLDYLNNLQVKDYLYFICLKELLIKNVIDIDVDILLDKIDDYQIYEYCLLNKIIPKSRNTINYQYYKIHHNKLDNIKYEEDNTNIILDLLSKVKVYKDLEYILKLTNTASHPDFLINEIIKYINTGYNEDFCIQHIDTKDPGLIKLLLAHLISSKKINNLILALNIARSHAFTVVDNYDIDLIYLFLLKYFLFYREVLINYKKLDIKNNQMLYMSFIWSDVYINLTNKLNNPEMKLLNNPEMKLLNNPEMKLLNNPEMKIQFREYIDETLNSLMTALPKFIEANKIAYALNMIQLYKEVESNIVKEELEKGMFIKKSNDIKNSDIKSSNIKNNKEGNSNTENNDIKSSNIKNISQFKYTLGSHCAYLFDKNTELTKINFPNQLFENNIKNITDEEFKEWFMKNKKLYHV